MSCLCDILDLKLVVLLVVREEPFGVQEAVEGVEAEVVGEKVNEQLDQDCAHAWQRVMGSRRIGVHQSHHLVGGPVERHVDQVSDRLVEEDALEVLPVSKAFT